jgi:predicted MFS family arabinose efflux permease
MLVQAAALVLLLGDGGFLPALLAAILLGAGTALVYPTLIAAVSDAVQPVDRAPAVGVYRFWRDFGFVAGALIGGVVADTLGASEAIAVVAALTAASGVWVAATGWSAAAPRSSAGPMADIGTRA